MKTINRLFWKGLIVVMPITITIYVLLVILNKAESIFGQLIKNIVGNQFYIPGLGILITIILMVMVGLMVSNILTGSIINFFINQFEKFPVIKAIYNPLRDLMSLFAGGSHDNMKKVVIVKLENLGVEAIGLVTREEFTDLPDQTFEPDKIAVYVPMSYMLGGFTAIVPRSMVRELDIPVEKAIKLAITGWIKADKISINSQ
ncbi:MAG: hypothetical protein CME62_07345 [Halobacteriovoraceae bacterium]|nr:hypothetical protein [Halobacteriovoraceae bacterium]|tara:strand:- start:41545 stop:42150 length:606 start_codon:yes stop_codon:yes gene_type:complete